MIHISAHGVVVVEVHVILVRTGAKGREMAWVTKIGRHDKKKIATSAVESFESTEEAFSG